MTTATERDHTSMRAIDGDFLKGVATASDEFVTTIEVTRERPYLDIEIVSDPHIDPPLLPDAEPDAELLSQAFLARYEQLRKPFGERVADVVLVRGTPEIEAPLGGDRNGDDQNGLVWRRAFDGLRARGHAVLDATEAHARGYEVASVFRVRSATRDHIDGTLAFVVVVGWPADVGAGTRLRLRGAEQLILALASSIGINTPVHVIGVAGGAGLPMAFLAECQRLQMSLVIDGARERRNVLTLSRTILRPGAGIGSTEVAVVPSPGFKRGVGRPGLTRVRIDAAKGESEIAFRHDLGSDRPSAPVQVVRPLVSASRVTSSERRLHERVHELIGKALAAPGLEAGERERITQFRTLAANTWRESGYAALCDGSGQVPLPQTRHADYNLLLLLRERDGGYDLLLSNHSPLRPSQLSDWNTLLLPAFKDVRALLGYLRDDVLRQVGERADDFSRAEHVRNFRDAVERILAEDGRPGDDLWADELREVAYRQIRKISPTNGAVTEFDYHLVTLLPLIDRSAARPPGASPDDPGDLRAQKHKIIAWLEGLDTVRCDDGVQTSGGLAIEALMKGEPGCDGIRA